MSEPPAASGNTAPAASGRRLVITFLLLLVAPLAAAAALTHWILGASWLKSCLWSPLALVAFFVWAWIQKYGSSGSYGTYQAIARQTRRKP